MIFEKTKWVIGETSQALTELLNSSGITPLEILSDQPLFAEAMYSDTQEMPHKTARSKTIFAKANDFTLDL